MLHVEPNIGWIWWGQSACQDEEDNYSEDDNHDEEPDDQANQQVAAPLASSAMNIIATPRNDVQQFSKDALVIFSISHANFVLVI